MKTKRTEDRRLPALPKQPLAPQAALRAGRGIGPQSASDRGAIRRCESVRWGRVSTCVLVLAAALVAGSCRRAVEKARRNIRLEAVESVERQGLTGAEVRLRVRNDTGYKLRLLSARVGIYYASGRVATVVLREPVEVPRRTEGTFTTLWRLKISDPMALYVLVRKLRSGDLSQVGISYDVEGRGGPAPVKIEHARMPLSEFLSTFGLTTEDVKNYLQ